jgi:Ca2+-binding EF-hand superfamily protein
VRGDPAAFPASCFFRQGRLSLDAQPSGIVHFPQGTNSMNLKTLSRAAVVAGALAAPCLVRAEDEKPAQKDPARLFAELDKNGDGKLKGDEIGESQKRFFEHLLRVAGKEKDGELTKEEFLKGFKPDDLKVNAPAVPGPFGGGNGPPPGQLFQAWDGNKDGKLTLDEIQSFMRGAK